MITLIVLCAIGIAHSQHAPNVCTGHPHGTLVRNTQDCSTYFHCFNGNPMLSTCLNNQLFNSITGLCDHPDRVDCFQCPVNAFIDVPVANECNQFVRCFNNVSEQLTCNTGLAFDRDYLMCNLEALVECPFEVMCPREHDNLIFTRDRDNCAKWVFGDSEFNWTEDMWSNLYALRRFFICINGSIESRTCPDTLHFNPITNMCDKPENTECQRVSKILTSASIYLSYWL